MESSKNLKILDTLPKGSLSSSFISQVHNLTQYIKDFCRVKVVHNIALNQRMVCKFLAEAIRQSYLIAEQEMF